MSAVSTRILAAALGLVITGALGPVPVVAEPLPFHGAWSGGPADCGTPFRFDEDTYTPPGGEPMRIVRVRKDGRSHRISMAGGYTVTVTVKGRTMLWESEASGDMFELRRCR